ncbi:MAG: glycosyl hydrolase 53 family protein [Treponema sp.]
MKKVTRAAIALALASAMLLTGCSNVLDNSSSSETTGVTESRSVAASTSSSMNSTNLTHGIYTSDFTNGSFTVHATSKKYVGVVYCSATTLNSTTFTQTLQLCGGGSTSYRSVSFVATSGSTVTVYATGADGRYLALANSSGTVVSKQNTSSSIASYSFSISSSGTYYLYSTKSGINIFYINLATAGGGYTIDATIDDDFIRGVDISMVSAIEDAGYSYYDEDGNEEDVFAPLKDHGVNWVRIRIWHNPASDAYGDDDWARVKPLVVRAKAAGLNVLLDFHYSDTWADPSNQKRPAAWDSDTSLSTLEYHIYNYTYYVVKNLQKAGVTPDMVQIGNEIDSGIFLTNSSGSSTSITGSSSGTNLAQLLLNAAKAVRTVDSNIKIMIHLSSGGDESLYTWFFNRIATHSGTAATVYSLDDYFDVIGLSYYPYYSSHKSLACLQDNIENLKSTYGKEVVVAETSYGWSTGYSDNTGNVFYTDAEDEAANLLVNSSGSIWTGVTTATRSDGTTYVPATEANQANVLCAVFEAAAQAGAEGVFYWGGDWIPTGDSIPCTWENQALFDFNGKCLEAMNVFNLTGN